MSELTKSGRRVETGAEVTAELTFEGREIREEVFVREQGYVEEFDDIDKIARHAVISLNGRAAAAGRVFPHPEEPGVFVIGRIAVRKEFRKLGLGRAVLAALEADARESGAKQLSLLAQLHAVPFYEKCGFERTDRVELEEDHPHLWMRKKL